MTKERSRWGGTGAKCRKRRSPVPGWNTKPSSAKTRHESASRGFPFTSVHQERFQRAGETHHQASPRLGWGHFTRVGNDFPWNQGLQLLELLQERSTQRKMHALSDKKKDMNDPTASQSCQISLCMFKKNCKREGLSWFSSSFPAEMHAARAAFSETPSHTRWKSTLCSHVYRLLFRSAAVSLRGQNVNGAHHLENRALMVRDHTSCDSTVWPLGGDREPLPASTPPGRPAPSRAGPCESSVNQSVGTPKSSPFHAAVYHTASRTAAWKLKALVVLSPPQEHLLSALPLISLVVRPHTFRLSSHLILVTKAHKPPPPPPTHTHTHTSSHTPNPQSILLSYL